MSRVPSLSSPFLLGFDEIERALDRVVKGADGYPPYNIERCDRDNGQPERLRITLAVAGFTRDQLEVTTELQNDRRGNEGNTAQTASRNLTCIFCVLEYQCTCPNCVSNGRSIPPTVTNVSETPLSSTLFVAGGLPP